MSNTKSIHVLGGGIMGLTSAWYLSQEGFGVTVIDKGDMSGGTSYGNAGMVVPSHFIPMASPGVIEKGVKWMFDKKSPFYIKPKLSLGLAQWLWQFKRSCTVGHVDICISVLYEVNEWSKELYRSFAELPGFDFDFEEKGLLMLYKTAKQAAEEKEIAEKAHSLGINAELVEGLRLKRLEPNVTLDVIGGVYYKGDAHLYPDKFVEQLKSQLVARGVQFVPRTEVKRLRVENGAVRQLLLSDGNSINVEQLVIAGGAWTAPLLKRLKVRLLLQPGKGYSFTQSGDEQRPSIPSILTESKVAVTPMGANLRIGGTLELGSNSQKVDPLRLQGILESIPKYYPYLKVEKPAMADVWMGYRPCTPDGMPYIGRIPTVSNAIVATGHGMMGMSMGPATGKLVSELASGKTETVPVQQFRLDR